MFGLPIGLLIRIGLALALAAALAYGWHLFTGHYKDIGRAEVQAAWDADKAVRNRAIADQTSLWDAQRQKTEVALSERDQARQEAANAIAARSTNLPPVVRDQRVPGAFVGVLRDGRDQANAAGTASKPHEAAADSSTGADDSNLGLIADWIVQVTDILAECRDRVDAWQSFYRGLQAAQLKEAP